MQEITATGEIGRNKVEINVNNILKQKVFHDIDNLGNKFYQKNPRREKNLGNWEVKNDRGSIKRKLEISKGKEKQHLTINFEQKKMTSLDFTLSDGKTVVNLQINEDRRLIVSRKDIKGRKIYGSENLNPREYLELTNFPFKISRDIIVNAIVDTVDPSKFIRYATPIVGLVAGAGFTINADQISAQNWKDLFLSPAPISQPVGDLTTSYKESKPGFKKSGIKRLTELEKQINQEKKVSSDNQEALGLLQELNFISRFYDPEKSLNQPVDEVIRNYLKNPTNPQNKNRYIGPDGKLVGNIEKALKNIQNNPKSQDSFYGLLDAIHEFNTGKGIVTPRKILDQANATGDNLRTAYIGTKDKVTGEPEFNRGLIKGNEYFGYILPGDFIVTEVNQMGLVTSITKDESGNLLSVNVSVFDEQTGKLKTITISAEDYPIGFSYFPK